MNPIIKDLCLKAVSAGFRVTPVYSSGKTQPYANGESYPYNDYPQLWTKATAVGAVLDDRLLLDWDNNKPNVSAPTLEELTDRIGVALPTPFQGNSVSTSLHFLFKVREGIPRESLYQSQDGQFTKGVDLKTGNQLMHIKPEASDGTSKWQDWPTLNNLQDAPEALIEAMTKNPQPFKVAPYKPFNGQYHPRAMSKFQRELKHFAGLAEGQDGGRNNALNNLALRWFSISYSGDMDPDQVQTELYRAASQNRCEGVEATIRSAKTKAFCQPRKFTERKLTSTEYHSSRTNNPRIAPLKDFTPHLGGELLGEDVPDGITLLEAFDDRLRVFERNFYWWNGRVWELADNSLIRKKIGVPFIKGRKKASQARVKATVAAMKDHADKLKELDPPAPRVYFLNGVLHIPSSDFTPHQPEHANSRTLSVSYDPKATCHAWTQWLNDIFRSEISRIELLQEMMGWLLSQDNFGIEKALLFLGPPRAGKGVISKILEAILEHGATAFKLADIDDKTLGSMRHKNVAIDNDSVSAPKWNNAQAMRLFKCITSNDRINVRVIYEAVPWVGRLGCKLLIVANSAPILLDDSSAAANRIIPIKFDRSFLGKEDSNLYNRLVAELPGIVSWAVEGLLRLVQRRRFELPASSADLLQTIISEGGEIQDFIEEVLSIDTESRASDTDIWESYRRWSINNHRDIEKRQTVLKAIADALQGSGVRRSSSIRLPEGKVARGFYGLSVHPEKAKNRITPIRS